MKAPSCWHCGHFCHYIGQAAHAAPQQGYYCPLGPSKGDQRPRLITHTVATLRPPFSGADPATEVEQQPLVVEPVPKIGIPVRIWQYPGLLGSFRHGPFVPTLRPGLGTIALQVLVGMSKQ